MKRGISPIVAVVLLIAIAVISAVGLYFWAGGLVTKQATPGTPVSITATPLDGGRVLVANLGTLPLSTGELFIAEGGMAIVCDDASIAAGEQGLCTIAGSGTTATIAGASTGVTSVYVSGSSPVAASFSAPLEEQTDSEGSADFLEGTFTNTTSGSVRLARSWPEIRITNTALKSWLVDTAADSEGNTWASWREGLAVGGFYPSLYLKKVDRYGVNLTGDILVTTQVTGWNSPVLVRPSGEVVVVFAKNNTLRMKLYNSAGVNTTDELTVWTSTRGTADPLAALGPNNDVYIAWDDREINYNYGEIAFMRAGFDGSVLLTKTRVSYSPGNGSHIAHIYVASNGNAYIGYHDQRNYAAPVAYTNQFEAYYRVMSSTGANITEEIRVSNSVGGSFHNNAYPGIDGNTYCFWYDDRATGGTYNVYMRAFDASGNPITGEIALTEMTGSQWADHSFITQDANGYFNIATEEDRTGNVEIWYMVVRTDGTKVWYEQVSDTVGSSEVPWQAMDPYGNGYLLWYDDTPGNYELYYSNTRFVFYNGTFVSKPIDAVVNSTWGTLSWSADTPVNTNVVFYFRTADSEAGLTVASWNGPYAASGASLSAVPAGRWGQYNITFGTTHNQTTATVNSVSTTFRAVKTNITYAVAAEALSQVRLLNSTLGELASSVASGDTFKSAFEAYVAQQPFYVNYTSDGASYQYQLT